MTLKLQRFDSHWRKDLGALIFALTGVIMFGSANSETLLPEEFGGTPQSRWEYIADTVMGGVSKGKVQFVTQDGKTVLKLTGQVSTENNGGFIQARLKLAEPLPDLAEGVWLKVRGNGQRYFVHLRTSGTVLPWQYYQAAFDTTESWQLVRLDWKSFKPSGGLSGSFLSDRPEPTSVKSIAIVAFGREHTVDVEVAKLGYF